MSKYKTTMSDLMLTIESKKALDKKAKKSGMPKSILSKVYDRGMAAWKGGHRPGTTPQQWALARVNSFITKSSGTWGGADKDLAKQVRGRAEELDLDLEEYLEDLDENLDVRYDTKKQGWFDRQGKRRYLGIGQTNALMKKALDKAKKTGDFINPFKMKHGQKAEDLELQERAPRRGDYQVNSQKKDTPIKNIDHFATKQQADAFAAKVKKDGGKVDSITKLEEVEETIKIVPVHKSGLPPHLKKLFDKDGNFIDPRSQAKFDKFVKDTGGSDAVRKKYNIYKKEDGSGVEECWSTHKQVGTKMKGGKRVPNCVPKNEDNTEDKDVVSNTSGKNKSESRAVPKDKETDQPKKYVSGLSDKDKKAHDKHLEKGSKKADDDKSAYKQSPADKKAKTKPSKHTKKFKQMYGEVKQLSELTVSVDKVTKAKNIAKKMAGNMTGAVREIEKIMKGLSDVSFVRQALQKYNEEKDNPYAIGMAAAMKSTGDKPPLKKSTIKKAHDIADKVKKEEVIKEFSTAQIKTLEREYAPLKGRTMSPDQVNKMTGMIKKMSKDQLNKLAQASIPFVTSTAKSELVINRGMKWTDFKEAMKMPFKPKEKGEDKDAKIDKLEKENQMLKVKAEVEKMVEPNKDTGEVPLKVGLAQKILKDMKSGKKIKIKEKEGTKLKGIGLGKTKIEVDPEIDISPSAGGDPKTSHSQ